MKCRSHLGQLSTHMLFSCEDGAALEIREEVWTARRTTTRTKLSSNSDRQIDVDVESPARGAGHDDLNSATDLIGSLECMKSQILPTCGKTSSCWQLDEVADLGATHYIHHQ